MSEQSSGTGPLTGLTTFLVLAFIIPGVVYLAAILLLFEREVISAFVPGTEMGADVTVGAVIVLGLLITSIVFPLEMFFESLLARGRRRPSLTTIIFRAEKRTPIGWYFWQLWGQKIMHLNVAVGLLLIYAVSRVLDGPWTLYSWKDLTLIVVVSNLECWRRFRGWHGEAVAELAASNSLGVGG